MASAIAAAARRYAISGRTALSGHLTTRRSLATNTSGLAALSHRLTKQLSATANDQTRGSDGSASAGTGNLVFSPLSIHSALSLVALGARGRTLSELLDALGEETRDGLADNVRAMVERALPAQSQPGGPRVKYANALWHEATRMLKPAYCDDAAAFGRATVHAVDFISKPGEAVNKINTWVADATNNLIKSIVNRGSVEELTRLVITNAIYFKGKWETPFLKSDTKKRKFHRVDGSDVDAQFMSSHREQYIAVHDGFKVLKMSYARSDTTQVTRTTMPPRYSMCVFLPDARDGLCSLEDMMASTPGFVHDHLPRQRVSVGEFWVPKFKLSFSDSITKTLRNLGIMTAFTDGAELHDMLEPNGEPPSSFRTSCTRLSSR